jgi:hypothetical protein
MKGKKDVILIVVTVILVIVLIVGFIYDRNSAVLQRTNLYDVSVDDNLEVVKMNKVGFLYMRAAYEAKLKIKNGNAQDYIITLASVYGGMGQMFDYTQYKQYESEVLTNVSIKPNPMQDSFIWVLGAPLKENSSENIVYIISLEGENEAYIYLYYSRK